jgi:hypothetical protein
MQSALASTILLLALSSLNSCSLATEPIQMTNTPDYCSGFYSSSPGGFVIRDSATWEEHFPETTPQVDFSQQTVIAIAWPMQSGCEYCVEAITDISSTSDGIEVSVGSLPSLGPCRVIFQPRQVITIPATALPITFTGAVPK